MAVSRRYDAVVRVSDPEVYADFIRDYSAGEESASLDLEVRGLEITDERVWGSGGPSMHHPFTGDRAPELIPKITSLTWVRTETSGLAVNLQKPVKNPGLPEPGEFIELSNGIVRIRGTRIKGTAHTEFNRGFRRESDRFIEKVTLFPYRAFARRQWISPETNIAGVKKDSIFPLLGRVCLFETALLPSVKVG